MGAQTTAKRPEGDRAERRAEAATDDRLTEALRARGQRVTAQRLVIHRVVADLGRHVTAEQVLDAVGDRLPNVSLPTVYATLELLEELGLLRRVATGGGAAVYDPRIDEHHHLVCRVCGRAEDLDVPVDVAAAVSAARERGFTPRHAEVTVAGVCARCAAA
jgi:Fe2+ or Zn2+ uptake regulation protein